jgi:hypothetical protein
MKRQLFPVLVLALILPALTGCPKDSGDDNSTPSGNLGDGNLVLKGTVYEPTNFDDETGEITFARYTTADTVEVWAEGSSSEKLGEGALTNGEFNISISKKPTVLDDLDSVHFFYGWKDQKANPTDVKVVMIFLKLKNAQEGIYKFGAKTSHYDYEYVDYLYVDKDVTITLGEKLEQATSSYAVTYTAATLALSKGWNALHYKYKETSSGTVSNGFHSVSVGNLDLGMWTFDL